MLRSLENCLLLQGSKVPIKRLLLKPIDPLLFKTSTFLAKQIFLDVIADFIECFHMSRMGFFYQNYITSVWCVHHITMFPCLEFGGGFCQFLAQVRGLPGFNAFRTLRVRLVHFIKRGILSVQLAYNFFRHLSWVRQSGIVRLI